LENSGGNEKETRIIAEELYNYYKGHPNINTELWLELLLLELSRSLMMTRHDIENLLEDIIRKEKNLSPENLTPSDKKELFREISEWLVAEGILKMVKSYENRIAYGIQEGFLIRINEIIKVSVIKELGNIPRFEDMEGLKNYLVDNYLIDTSCLVGSGKRMNVYNFIPLSYPLPFPREDSLTKAINFKYHDKFLVIRVMNNIYREFLSDKLEKSEHGSIEDFNAMNPFFTYKTSDHPSEQINKAKMARSMIKSGLLLKEHLKGKSIQKKSFSFIPPLMILKVKLQNSNTPEYVTIQQKVLKRGEISLFDSNFISDLASSKSFRYKVLGFIRAIKRLFAFKGLMPDLIGSGNILYNEFKNIYLVDINNVCREPDFPALATILLMRDIKMALMESLGFSILRKMNIGDLQRKVLERKADSGLLKDFFDSCQELNRKLPLTPEIADALMDFDSYQDETLLSFLKSVRFLDDLNEPVFLHNMDKLFHIERLIHRYRKGGPESLLKDDPFYDILDYKKGVWEKKSTYCLKDILENKKKGCSNWISFYTMGFYSSFVSSRQTGGL